MYVCKIKTGSDVDNWWRLRAGLEKGCIYYLIGWKCLNYEQADGVAMKDWHQNYDSTHSFISESWESNALFIIHSFIDESWERNMLFIEIFLCLFLLQEIAILQ